MFFFFIKTMYLNLIFPKDCFIVEPLEDFLSFVSLNCTYVEASGGLTDIVLKVLLNTMFV